jgi:hypothetical protein
VSNYVRESEIIPSDFKDDEFHVPRDFNFPTFNSVFKGTIRSKTTGAGKKALLFFQYTLMKNIRSLHSLALQIYSSSSVLFS